MDLVEDVHLRATGRTERGLADEIPHGVDAVVGGGVELLQVVRGARLDRGARVAHATRLTVVERGAVESLGEDAGRRGLARAAGPAEEVGMADPVLAHGVAQRADHVRLAADVREALGPVAAVERLVGHAPTLPGSTGTVVGLDDTRPRKWRPGDLRHTAGTAESCCLPALTRFTDCSCTGPGRHIRGRVSRHDSVSRPVFRPDGHRRRPAPGRAPGGVRERPNRHAWKACVGTAHRGFESLSLRQNDSRVVLKSQGGPGIVGFTGAHVLGLAWQASRHEGRELDLVFTAGDGRPVPRQALHRAVRDACARAGIDTDGIAPTPGDAPWCRSPISPEWTSSTSPDSSATHEPRPPPATSSSEDAAPTQSPQRSPPYSIPPPPNRTSRALSPRPMDLR